MQSAKISAEKVVRIFSWSRKATVIGPALIGDHAEGAGIEIYVWRCFDLRRQGNPINAGRITTTGDKKADNLGRRSPSMEKHVARWRRDAVVRRMDVLRGEVIKARGWNDSTCYKQFRRKKQFIRGTRAYNLAGDYVPQEWPEDGRFDLFTNEDQSLSVARAFDDLYGHLAPAVEARDRNSRQLRTDDQRAALENRVDTLVFWVFRQLDRAHHAVIDYKLVGEYREHLVRLSDWDLDLSPLPEGAEDVALDNLNEFMVETDNDWQSTRILEKRISASERSFRARAPRILARHGIESKEFSFEQVPAAVQREILGEPILGAELEEIYDPYEDVYQELCSFVSTSSLVPLYVAARYGLVGGLEPKDLGLELEETAPEHWQGLPPPIKAHPRELPCLQGAATRVNSVLRVFAVTRETRDDLIQSLLDAWFPTWFRRKTNPVLVRDGKFIKPGKKRAARKIKKGAPKRAK